MWLDKREGLTTVLVRAQLLKFLAAQKRGLLILVRSDEIIMEEGVIRYGQCKQIKRRKNSQPDHIHRTSQTKSAQISNQPD